MIEKEIKEAKVCSYPSCDKKLTQYGFYLREKLKSGKWGNIAYCYDCIKIRQAELGLRVSENPIGLKES